MSISSYESFAALRDDDRTDCAFRAWGSRRVMARDARPGSAQPFHQPGVVNPKSLRTVSRLPTSAHDVDIVYRGESKRAAGGWTFIRPFNEQYQYYKSYGNAGANALSSHHHNFPLGDVPIPQRIYSDESLSRVTKVQNSQPKRFNSVGVTTDRSYASPFYVQKANH